MYGDGDCFCNISRYDNGYTVRIMDPGVVKYNKARDKKNHVRGDKGIYLEYKDPWKVFIFKTDKEMITFLTKNVSKAVTASKLDNDTSEYETAWDMAATED